MWRLWCLIGWHNWWNADGDEFVCLDCGHTRQILPSFDPISGSPAAAARDREKGVPAGGTPIRSEPHAVTDKPDLSNA